MTLPEPQFIERDVNKITQEWISLYEQKTGKTLQPAQIERILIDVGVYRESLLRIGIQEAAKQNLVNFATYPMLDYLGELVGVYRIEAKYSKTTFKFVLTEALNFDYTIPANIEIESKDGKVIFRTLKAIIIPQGQLYTQIEGQAQTAGIIGNGYLSGEINNLITPIPYISEVYNITESSSGADEEGDESLRQRIKEAPEQFSNAGSKGAYRFHTISAHQNIIDVAVIHKQPGVVEIYPLTIEGNPSQEIIDTVQNYLSGDKVRPLTDLVLVKSPERIDFQIIANLTLYNFADLESVQALIDQKIDEYKKSLRSKLGLDIVPTQVIALLNSIYGVYKVELITPFLQELGDFQWANCTGYQVNISGYTNG